MNVEKDIPRERTKGREGKCENVRKGQTVTSEKKRRKWRERQRGRKERESGSETS